MGSKAEVDAAGQGIKTGMKFIGAEERTAVADGRGKRLGGGGQREGKKKTQSSQTEY